MLGTSKEIKYPGLNILPPGVERHIVNGGGLTAFHIFPDDEIEIINATIVSSPPNKISLINSIMKVIKPVRFLLICKRRGLVLNSCVSSFQNSIGIQ